jgi:hypothetical protein
MSTIINYEEPYMDTLYHYLAEIYIISNKDDLNKEEKIKDYINKIKANYNKGKEDIGEINKLIKLIEDNDLTQFKEILKKIID